MKLVALCSIAVVLGSMMSPAQSSGQKLSTTITTVVPASSNCPVDFSAQKGFSAGQFQNVPDKNQQASGPSQPIQLTLNNSTYSKIIGVRVTAYGLNAKGQVTPADAVADTSSAMQKSFDLKLTIDPKSTGSVDLMLSGFTAVAYLNVDSIRYAGGSTWQPSAQQTCHVIPNGTMLIGNR